jgi:glycosyltransferase involved in cell wall biosynthesis
MRILLLSDIPPNRTYPAALFLDSLCRLLPKDAIACFCVVNPELDASVTPDLDWFPIQFATKPLEQTHSRTGPRATIFHKLYNFAWETYVSRIKIPQLAASVIEFGRQQDCDVVWCTLEGQTMIRLARRVADGLGVPLRTQVFDPPYWWLRVHNVNKFSSREILAEYNAALQHSRSCAAASWAMAEEYHRIYGTKTVPVVPSLNAELAYPPHHHNLEDAFIIGMAGQLYASREWQALLDALNYAEWKIAGRDVKLWVLGHHVTFNAYSKMHIEYLGWHSQAETIEILSNASLLYCPYWFDPAYKAEARLSFPSKLVTYLAAGRPVLFHGPEYASPHRFLAQHNAGFSCHSLEPEHMIDVLTQVSTNTDLYSRIAQSGTRAFQEHLTVQTMRSSFAKFLEVDESFLLPG